MGRRALALGAPRYRHVGRLLLFHLRGPRAAWELLADATGPQVRAGTRGGDGGVPGRGEPPSQPHGRFSPQVGSYFGASLCALDPDGDGSAEVVLVGAPMFYGAGSGGRVAVCTLRVKVGDPRPAPPRLRVGRGGHPAPCPPQGGQLRCQQMLQGEPGHPLGRFGASLARLGDVDGDQWPDVAVGAPLEDEERGAVYVFRGKRGGVSSQYSQVRPPPPAPGPGDVPRHGCLVGDREVLGAGDVLGAGETLDAGDVLGGGEVLGAGGILGGEGIMGGREVLGAGHTLGAEEILGAGGVSGDEDVLRAGDAPGAQDVLEARDAPAPEDVPGAGNVLGARDVSPAWVPLSPQRISGAQFSSGPRYFGQAISGGQDLTGDRLPDVAVGAQGQVLLLRYARGTHPAPSTAGRKQWPPPPPLRLLPPGPSRCSGSA